jgi:7,8-dihydropterin-6-yl-methyl-4-(beta-D-ribofuranosyl)aminobenzene 5'-phosphate synthase
MVDLVPIDRLEITILIDNILDLSTAVVSDLVQSPHEWSNSYRHSSTNLQATHGFSALLDVYSGNVSSRILYDTGNSPITLQNNIMTLGIDPNTIDEIVISHGHWDHFGGLSWLLKEIRKKIPVHLHKAMVYERGIMNKGRVQSIGQFPELEKLEGAGAELIFNINPEQIANGGLVISGTVKRSTDFEKGIEHHVASIGGKWVDDSLILDDRCLIANIAGKGLFIISGCSHAGIINILRHSIELTGIDVVYGILGGLHLVGKDSKTRTKSTISHLKEFSPKILVPGHCTGWKAKLIIAQEFPDSVLGLSVGNRYRI